MWRKTPDAKTPPPPSEAHVPAIPAAPERIVSTTNETRPEASQVHSSLRIKGEITGGTDLYLDGEVEGSIRMRGACVTVGPRGRVQAGMEAREIVVEGRVDGDLQAHERAHIRRSGSVRGDVTAPRLVIEDGAIVRGRVLTAKPGSAAPANPQSPASSEEVLPAVALEAGG